MNSSRQTIRAGIHGATPVARTDAAPGKTRGRTSPGRIDPHLVCLLEPNSAVAESFYRLRYALETRHAGEGALVVGVTSPGDGDGKTLTAINLAGALAQDTRARVLLIDLDLRHTGTGALECLGLKGQGGAGVVDWIGDPSLDLPQVVRSLPEFNLHLVSAGENTDSPYELLKSDRLDALIAQARGHYDFVILDTPRVSRLPDTELISRLVDGYLVVVKANHTPRAQLEETLNRMTPENVLGLIFNAEADLR